MRWNSLSAQIEGSPFRNGDSRTSIKARTNAPPHQLNFTAENIRNVKSGKGVYPSPVELEGVVFDIGQCKVHGDADFLAKPHVALRAILSWTRSPWDYFKRSRKI